MVVVITGTNMAITYVVQSAVLFIQQMQQEKGV